MVKQADLVLAMQLCPDAFTDEQKARDFAYYESLTVRDSSLSAAAQAVIAAETGHLDLAYDYLAETALMDLDDLEHNTRDGLHLAALAGAWMVLVPARRDALPHGPAAQLRATAAARADPAVLHRLPARPPTPGQVLPEEASYVLDEAGPALEIKHHGQPVSVTHGEPHPGPSRTAAPAAARAAAAPGAATPRSGAGRGRAPRNRARVSRGSAGQ